MKLTRDQDELSRKRRGRHAVVEDFFVVVGLLDSAVIRRRSRDEERERSSLARLLLNVTVPGAEPVTRWLRAALLVSGTAVTEGRDDW